MSRFCRAASPLVLAVVVLSSCSVIASLFGDPNSPSQQGTSASATSPGPDEAQRDAEAVAELDAQRAALTETDPPELAALIVYAEAHCEALESGVFTRLAGGPTRSAELEQILTAALEAATEPDQIQPLLVVRGRLYAATGRPNPAAQDWLAALDQGAGVALFNAIAGLPRSASVDAAVLDACARVRPRVDEAEVADFVALCLERAGGDASRLAWASAAADLETYERVVREREQQALAEQVEAERLAQQRMWLMATMFATGRCRFSDCMKDGWDTETAAGVLHSRCRFSDCMKDGWDTELPDGTRAETRCRFSDCATEGWDTRLPDGSTAATRCRFSNCFEDGWDTRFDGGAEASGRCRFSKCFEDGWTVSPRSGPSFECRCRFGDCLEDGTECG